MGNSIQKHLRSTPVPMRPQPDQRIRAMRNARFSSRTTRTPMRYSHEMDHSDDLEILVSTGLRSTDTKAHPQQQLSSTRFPIHPNFQYHAIAQRPVERVVPDHDTAVAECGSTPASILSPVPRLPQAGRPQVRFSSTRAFANTRAQTISYSSGAAQIDGRHGFPPAIGSPARQIGQYRASSVYPVVSASTSTRAVSSVMTSSRVAVAPPRPQPGPRIAPQSPYSRSQPRVHGNVRAPCSCSHTCFRGCRCACHGVAVANYTKRDSTYSAVIESQTSHRRGNYEGDFDNNDNGNYYEVDGDGNVGNDLIHDIFC